MSKRFKVISLASMLLISAAGISIAALPVGEGDDAVISSECNGSGKGTCMESKSGMKRCLVTDLEKDCSGDVTTATVVHKLP